MTREEILDKAKSIVRGERDQEYGGPEHNFTKIAHLWSFYLDAHIGPEDVAAMMILLKVARVASSEYKSIDSWIDIAGYAACGGEIATR